MDAELEIEAVYYLLRLETLARGELRLYKKTVYKPEARIPLPLPLDKKHASPAFMFWKPIPRSTEANAMFSWMNGYFISKHSVDDTGSLEAQLKAARVGRKVAPKTFDYTVRHEWIADSMLCSQCNNLYPRDPYYWHKDSKSRDGLRTDACVHCRRQQEQQRVVRQYLLKAA